MRMVFSAWVLAYLVAAGVPGRASADPFVLSDPRLDPSWGGQPGQPIAPSAPRKAEWELPGDVVGKARNAAYLEALRGSRQTLDEATAYHFYASAGRIYVPPDHAQFAAVIGDAAVAEAGVLAAKIREAEPALMAELDARFAVLTAALERADAITLPSAGAGAVTYCRWIRLASGTQPSRLTEDLWRQCLVDRDRFINDLVRRLADVAVIPDLPATDAAPGTEAGYSTLGSDLALSLGALPGETLAPMPYAPLAAAFGERLRARFQAARPRLEARLGEALARRAASDVLLPPTYECNGLLGPYAGPLARLPAAAEVADALSQACLPAAERQVPVAVERIRHDMLAGFDAELARVRDGVPDAARIERTPEASCAAKLAPHFPLPVPHYDANAWPFAGLDAAQSTALRQACVDAGTRVLRAVMDKHFERALLDSTPDADTLTGWEAHGWYVTPPGGTDWIEVRGNPFAMSSLRQKFQAEYDLKMAPRRAEAAQRFAAAIAGLFKVDTGVEPPAAAILCTSRERAPAGATLTTLFNMRQDPVAERRELDALRAKPALGPSEAEALVVGTCRTLHAGTIAARVRLAEAAANIPGTFTVGEKLAVPSHPNGDWLPVDPATLVGEAAIDGIQVAFQTTGYFSKKEMSITPFGRASPRLDGKLIEVTQHDKTKLIGIDELQQMQGLDSPEDTIRCLLGSSESAHAEAKAQMLASIASAMWSYVPELHGIAVRDAMNQRVAANACDAAKTAFLNGSPGR